MNKINVTAYVNTLKVNFRTRTLPSSDLYGKYRYAKRSIKNKTKNIVPNRSEIIFVNI